MTITNLKFALVVVVVLAFFGTGTSLVSYHAQNAGQRAPQKSANPQLVAELVNDDKDAAKDDEERGEEVPNRNVDGDRVRSQKNLRQLGLALLNYHDTYANFPTSATYDKDGKALLSWRVAILPHMKCRELYEEFNLGESWDSEHNKKLLGKMPAVFKAPGIKTKKPYTTYYQLIVGEGALFDGMMNIGIRNVTDGLANTIMAVEAAKPVPWTKPEDLTYDPDKPLPKFGGVFRDGFNFIIANGSAHFAKNGFDEKKMRAAITRAGGERVNVDDLDP